jgi:hypothetical protein
VDLNIIRIAVLVSGFVAFLVLVLMVYRRSQRQYFEQLGLVALGMQKERGSHE